MIQVHRVIQRNLIIMVKSTKNIQAKSRDVVPRPRPPVQVAQVHLPAIIVRAESTKRRASPRAARRTRSIEVAVGHETRTEVGNRRRNGHTHATVTEIVDKVVLKDNFLIPSHPSLS